MRVAAIQMNSGSNMQQNLQMAEELLAEANEQGAGLAVLPENFSLMPERDLDRLPYAEKDSQGVSQEFLSTQARDLKMWIIAGSVPMVATSADKVRAACLVFNDQGIQVARYDKIHLFDVTVNENEFYKESDTFEPGPSEQTNYVCVNSPAGCLGLSVCYDLRFPELYRQLTRLGAQLLLVPSAFAATTGRAHWRTLLRARAIENQCYVIAPGQWGKHPSGRQTYGHSMIVSPWGDVLDEKSEGDNVVIADVDIEALARLRQQFPSLQHRQL